jgi:phosphoglucosamine mutase
VFDGDFVLALALHFRPPAIEGKQGSHNHVQLLRRANFEEAGHRVLRASVGDRYVLELMTESGASLGGEPSGHVILLDSHTAGDGILTAVKLAEVLVGARATLDDLADGFHPYPQVLDGLKVRKKVPLDSPAIAELIKSAERRFGDSGRLVIRYSGTEPLLRIMAEGPDASKVRSVVSELKAGLGNLITELSIEKG